MKYIVKSPDFKGDVVFGYDDNGFLSTVVVNAELNEKQWHFFHAYFPVTETYLKLLAETSKKMQIEQVLEDLTFAAFWEAYAYKMGDKKRTEKLWDALTESEKVAALGVIKKYHYWLACHPNVETAQAATWLKQRRWENDYSKK